MPTVSTAPAAARNPWHPTALLGVLALWLATLGNLPLWMTLWALPESHGWHAALTLSAWALVLLGVTLTFLSLWVWPRWLKPAGLVLLLTAAGASYFMRSYGVVIDPTMLANALNTDAREVRDLLSGTMAVALLAGVVLPGWWWWRQPVRAVPVRRLLPRQLGVGVLALLAAVVLLWLSFQDLASLMRNHKPLRYMINPFNTVYAVTRNAVGRAAHAQQPLLPLGEDATLPAAAADTADNAPLIVVVVGETARAANFGLGGYARDTTPRLARLRDEGELAYFSNVSSCGTNTQTSVPCIFSGQGRARYDADTRQENLLDVLQRAGLAVLWLDNQSGCKGVCDRVPHAETRTLNVPGLCEDGECFDEVMLRELPGQLEKLDPARRARGTVVVLHQMGSHGPAYYKRTPANFKPFGPECTSSTLQECPPQQIVDAYDNTIRYTDHFLAETIAWLREQKRPTALYYVSDHGESLGEKGLYLHGMPYSMAPQEQTHVPMVMWFSPAWQSRHGPTLKCVAAAAKQPWSHDNLFHTVLGMAGVRTAVHDAGQDLLSTCEPGQGKQL
jgi:lipid A ethanolaminephosphotransferase